MKTVWKYALEPDEFTIEMPRGAQVLSVDNQGGSNCMWAMVDPAEPLVTRRFRLAGTGHELDRPDELRFIGTVQMYGGKIVLHLFERVEDPNEAIRRKEGTMANHVRNTTAEIESNPAAGVATCLPGGIEASEARGQAELVRSSVLPAEMGDQRAAFEALGFKFGAPVDGDPLFIHAELPPGWSKAPSDHDMWSYILDAKGRRRASVFYKAAFYDRSARMSLARRYDIGGVYPDGARGERTAVVVTDFATGERIWTGGPESWDEAQRWLDANRPDHRDVVASWSGT